MLLALKRDECQKEKTNTKYQGGYYEIKAIGKEIGYKAL